MQSKHSITVANVSVALGLFFVFYFRATSSEGVILGGARETGEPYGTSGIEPGLALSKANDHDLSANTLPAVLLLWPQTLGLFNSLFYNSWCQLVAESFHHLKRSFILVSSSYLFFLLFLCPVYIHQFFSFCFCTTPVDAQRLPQALCYKITPDSAQGTNM